MKLRLSHKILLGLLALLLPATLALAPAVSLAVEGATQPAADTYDLSWWTADGGGQTFSTGLGYSLGGTVGQPDAGVMSGTGYRLDGGFWQGGGGVYRMYLPLVARNY